MAKGARRKHVPQRTCVGCRVILPKRQLIRIVRGENGVEVDPTGKLAGRGAYLHDSELCWEKALKGSLAHALKASFTAEEVEKLAKYAALFLSKENRVTNTHPQEN